VTSSGIDRGLAAFLHATRLTGGHTPLVRLGGDTEDEDVYATRVGGRELIVKLSRTRKNRVVAWASGVLTEAGVPTAPIVGHGDRLLVEGRLPGMPLDRYHAGHHRELAEFAAATAGRLLRRVHAIPAGAGTGNLTQLPPLASRAPVDLHELRVQAQQVLHRHGHLLTEAPGALVHGDWTARNVIVDAGRITGIVAPATMRGGDPVADLARWSLLEPAELTRALFAGYFRTDPDEATRTRLALHRIRLGFALLARHVSRGEHTLVAVRRAQLRDDLAGRTERIGPGEYVDYRRALDACC
jgi:hypothetical protein